MWHHPYPRPWKRSRQKGNFNRPGGQDRQSLTPESPPAAAADRAMGRCVGIVREAYSKWERRAPLTPAHVAQLVKRGVRVVVQPSRARVFSDEQYARAGATLSEDLAPAGVILGIKQVPVPSLLPDKTYLFFSHTVKAQADNMALLDAVLERRVRLIDYECITHGGERGGRRLVAFGRNAGRAGMLAGMRGLGERLLNLGVSSPFVNVASAYMYSDLEHAKDAVERAGKRLQTSGGIPEELGPLTFVFTGNGNVSKGAQEIFKLLPHRMVHPSELPTLQARLKGDDATRMVYGTVVDDLNYFVRPIDGAAGGPVSRTEYYRHPERYESVFHERVVPYTSLLVNCMYWDDRFPRLLTRDQLQALRVDQGNTKLLGIADISCDIGGGVEFLDFATEIERPFARYDLSTQRMVQDDDGLAGSARDALMMMSVDILPSELAIESSQLFGDKLLDYVDTLARDTDARTPLNESKLPKELLGACIASNGRLTTPFEYIHRMRAERERSRQRAYLSEKERVAGSTCIRLEGHLFDSGLINQVLNLIEAHDEGDGGFYLVDCQVRPNYADEEDDQKTMSSAIVQISMRDREQLDAVLAKVRALAELTSGANATVTELPDFCGTDYSKTQGVARKDAAGRSAPLSSAETTVKDSRTVVCFGAGLVAAPLVEYLSRDPSTHVRVVSAVDGEATRIARALSPRSNITPLTVNVTSESEAAKVAQLCADADCVVSLLPAPMHPAIAEKCIEGKTPLVTASYVSPEMRAFDKRAKDAGIPILCELGLDPGMDHMSAMKVIDEVKSHNGSVVSFSSVCGGLPAPEAADNPIGYKFSWSPRGVLTAALNTAQYKKDGRIINVKGEDLLASSERVNFLPAFALEQIPNRDSLPYADIYGIPNANSIYRGTLRYAGCCQILYQLRQLGLLDLDRSITSLINADEKSWPALLNELSRHRSSDITPEARGFLEFLGAFNRETPLAAGAPTLLDSFCSLLQEKLAYAPDERDMAIMHHEFGVEYPDGKKEKRTSTFVGYGNGGNDTIMAKTVGVTAAIGVRMILQDAVQGRGVLTPTTPDIYAPALARLEVEGVKFVEKTFPVA